MVPYGVVCSILGLPRMEHKATICQHLGSGLTVIWHHWQVLVKLQDYNVSPLFPNGEQKVIGGHQGHQIMLHNILAYI